MAVGAPALAARLAKIQGTHGHGPSWITAMAMGGGAIIMAGMDHGIIMAMVTRHGHVIMPLSMVARGDDGVMSEASDGGH